MFSVKKTVGYSDTDADGNLSFPSLVDYLQDCGSFHMNSIEPLQKKFDENHMGLFLAFMQVDIKRYADYGEELTINTWAWDMKNTFGLRNYTVYDVKERLCACSYAVGVFVDVISGRPAKLSEETLAKIPLEEKFDMEYTPRKISIPPSTPEIKETIKVRRYHLDTNKHVNNARYIDIAGEFTEETFKPRRIRAEYKMPAKLGENIFPKVYNKENGGNLVYLLHKSGKPYALIDFS